MLHIQHGSTEGALHLVTWGPKVMEHCLIAALGKSVIRDYHANLSVLQPEVTCVSPDTELVTRPQLADVPRELAW
jgi:hypothetical protein